MLLLILFILSAIFLGYAISKYFKFFENSMERTAFSILIGIAISSFVCFWISFLIKSLGDASLIATILFNLLIVGAALNKKGMKFDIGKISAPKIGISEILLVFLFLILAYFNSHSIFEDKTGNIEGISNTWADYALHVGIINSFALRDNFPPIYPILAQTPMRYPYLVDFFSAIMVKEGVPITYAITIPNLALIFCLIVLAYMFIYRFAGKKEIAAIAIILFMLNGNLGVAQFFHDYGLADNKNAFLNALPKVYSFLPAPSDGSQNYWGMNLQFMNLTYSVFIPQRSVLLGFPIIMVIFTLLWRIYQGKSEKLEYLLAGILASILPLIHASTFAIATLVCGFVFLLDIVFTLQGKNRKISNWIFFFIPVLLMAVPQLFFINEQPRTSSFLGPEIGWVSKAATPLGLAKFWIENTGAIALLGLVGILFIKRDQILFLLPFALVFIAANLFRFQPWDWDNIKLLMYWFFPLCILGAIFLSKIFDWLSKGVAFGKPVGIIVVALLVLISIFSALLTFMVWDKSAAVMWSTDDIKMANYIASNTPKNATFLTAGKHNHLVYTLAGRQILIGYDGHLWSHGLDYFQQSNAARELFASGNSDIAKRWGVDYVYIGPAEISEWGAKLSAFQNSQYKEIYENNQQGVYIFKVI